MQVLHDISDVLTPKLFDEPTNMITRKMKRTKKVDLDSVANSSKRAEVNSKK